MRGGGHAWQGVCMAGGACLVRGGSACQGACIVGGGVRGGEHAWQGGFILRDVVNERAVRILLECILVLD